MPSFTNREAVPPVERISMPSAESPRANSARPVLSETLIRARATVMTRLHTTGGMKRCARRRDYSSSLSAAGRGLLAEEPRHLLAAHRPRPLAWFVVRVVDDGENVPLRLAHESLIPSRALPVR